MLEDGTLFEHIGTVQDGMKTLSRPRIVLDAPDAGVLHVPRGEVRFEHASFRYADAGRRVIDDLNLVVKPGEKIGEFYWGPLVGGGVETWLAYVIALLFLLYRPQGLFGHRVVRRV